MPNSLLILTGILWLLASCGGAPEPAAVPWPEHPRPDLARAERVNLNGEWEFQTDVSDEGLAREWFRGKRFAGSALLPGLGAGGSGVAWFRRSIVAPEAWRGKTIWLRFESAPGSVRAWIGGAEAALDESAGASYGFDVTGLVSPGKRAALTVRSDSGGPAPDCPGRPGGLSAAWLEARPRVWLDSLRLNPRFNAGEWRLEAHLGIRGPGGPVTFFIESSGPSAGTAEGTAAIEGGKAVVLVSFPVSAGEAWTPGNPRIYPLRIRVEDAQGQFDETTSYFALRTTGSGPGGRFMLNGRPLYLRAAGLGAFWKPTRAEDMRDESLGAALVRAREMGFNAIHADGGAPPRLAYLLDRFGLLAVRGFEEGGGRELGTPLENALAAMMVCEEPGPAPLLSLRETVNLARQSADVPGHLCPPSPCADEPAGSLLDPAALSLDAALPDLQPSDWNGADFAGFLGPSFLQAKPGEKVVIQTYVSHFSGLEKPPRLEARLRAVNDLGGEIELFSKPRRVEWRRGEPVPQAPIVMAVPEMRDYAGVIAVELLDSSGDRLAANYLPVAVRRGTRRAPRFERISPRRAVLRAEGKGEFRFPLTPGMLAAGPARVEFLAEIAGSPSMVRIAVNGERWGETEAPEAAHGPGGVLSVMMGASSGRHGFLLRAARDVSPDLLAALRQHGEVRVTLEADKGDVAVFGEREGRYPFDPTLIVTTHGVIEE